MYIIDLYEEERMNEIHVLIKMCIIIYIVMTILFTYLNL